jgi:DNA-binding transcriptional LysR family regulator
VEELKKSRLAVRIQAHEISPSTRQLQALRNAEIDLGFVRLGVEEVPEVAFASMDDPYCLAVPRRHPLAREKTPMKLAVAAHEDFVGFASHHESDFFDQTMALCAEAGFRPQVRHVAGQFAGVLAMVSCGLGVAIVPASCLEEKDTSVVKKRLSTSRFRSRLLLIAPREPSSPSQEKVRELARRQLRALEERTRHLLE